MDLKWKSPTLSTSHSPLLLKATLTEAELWSYISNRGHSANRPTSPRWNTTVRFPMVSSCRKTSLNWQTPMIPVSSGLWESDAYAIIKGISAYCFWSRMSGTRALLCFLIDCSYLLFFLKKNLLEFCTHTGRNVNSLFHFNRNPNEVILHSPDSTFTKNKKQKSSWNILFVSRLKAL